MVAVDRHGDAGCEVSRSGYPPRRSRMDRRFWFASVVSGFCLLGSAHARGELVAYASYSGTDNLVRVNPDGPQVLLPGFNNPAGLALDSAGDLFVASSGSGAILKLAPGETTPTSLIS